MFFFFFSPEHFIKSLPEYHVVAPVRVDASGHFLSYALHHPVTSSRRKRDLGGSEDQVYYRIPHEEKDLFFNLTVNQELLSKSYIVERRYGNLSHVKMVASSGPPCHLRGTVLQQGTRVGTAALSACHGLVSHFLLCPQSLTVVACTPPASRFKDKFITHELSSCDVPALSVQMSWGEKHIKLKVSQSGRY